FLALDRREDPIDGHGHISKHHRVVQMIERRIQKPRGQVRVAVPALTEKTRHDRRDVERRGQLPRRGVIRDDRVPLGGSYGHLDWTVDCLSKTKKRSPQWTRTTSETKAPTRRARTRTESRHG